jgi:hypothetical protein
MMTPLYNADPRTRPTPASQRSQDASFERQRIDRDLRIRQEQLAAERADLATERRALERARQAWTEEQEQRGIVERREQHAEQRRTEAIASAEQLAGDLRHDVDAAAPGYVASQILAASRKAKGELPEEPLSGLAADIVRAGKLARGEVVADASVENLTARAIILSGKRASGVTLSADDERFLTSFLERSPNVRR